MANKTYSIQINGLQESIKAVDALSASLESLEKKIKALEGKAVNVGSKVSSGGGEKSSSKAALSEEEKLERQIAQIDEKRVAYSKEVYQNYLAAKDVLKETVNDQKSIAASERLQAKTYSNTISGMKQELADIKSAMQTVDLGDSDQLDKMAQRANELNNALKKIEESYGQFGRNVGNYQSAFDGMQKLSINVGGVVREFDSAREASKTLKNELIGLEAAGSGNTEVANELRSAYYNLQSAMDDATKSSKAMDEAMDYMQSFTAMASVGNGLKAFFGFDDSEIERSIQKLVSLQNVLKGIETIRKQMETAEGIGSILTKGSDKIDKMVAGITGAQVATNGLTMGSKAATVAVRGLSMALKGIGIGLVLEAINLLVQGIEWVSSNLTKWVKGNAELIKEEKLLDAQLDYVNQKLEERNDELSKAFYQGAISQEQYYRQSIIETTNAINDQIKALKEKAALEGGSFSENIGGIPNNNTIDLEFGAGSTQVKNLEELTRLWKFYTEAVLDGKDAMSKLSDESGSIDAWFRSLIYTIDDTKDDLVELGQIAIGEFLRKYEHAMQTMQVDTKAGERELAELKKEMDDNEMLRSVFMNLDQYIPVEGFRKRVQQIINLIRGVKTEMGDLEQRTVQQVLRSEQLKIDAMKDGAEKRKAQRELDKKKELADATLTAEDRSNIEKKYQQRAIKEEKEANKKKLSETKKNNREILEAEKDLSNLRISNMKEGLNKVLKQLEEERKQRLAKVEADGRLIAERQAEINKLYDKKIYDAKKEWAEKLEKTYKDMWDNIYNYSLETTRKIAEVSSLSGEVNTQGHEQIKHSYYYKDVNGRDATSSYGVQGKNQLSKETQKILGLDQQFNRELSDIYEVRKHSIEDYWTNRITMETRFAKDNYDTQLKLEKEQFENENRELLKKWDGQQKINSDWYEKQREFVRTKAAEEKWSQSELDEELLNVEKEYQKAATKSFDTYKKNEEAITKEHNLKLQKLEQDKVSKLQETNANYYRERLQELRDFQTAISNLESKQPVYNSWGIINLGETKKNNENLLKSYETLSQDIVKLKDDLQKKLDAKQISFDEFQNANRELDRFAEDVGQKMDKAKRELTIGDQIGKFIQSIEMYVQAGLQAVQTVMSAIEDCQDYEFDKLQEESDKENEMLQKKLDKQEEIIDKHKSNVDSIEDELANSRGDRRQHLIDQLNAEMEAERAAAIEKKKLEKEQERLEKKQDALEKKRREAEYKRNLMSIIVSTAMATANGLATQPFIPVGIAMGALATTLGMVQYALAAQQKPYAHGGQLDGGVAQGPRHRDGGIPVLGGRASIEGGEFITNRLSTANNIDLLEFINSKKKKVDVSDLIDFYSSGNIKRNISGIKTKFEDGGQITLPNTIDVFDNKVITALDAYSNRPIYVTVTDIENRMEQVRYVRTLAGVGQD